MYIESSTNDGCANYTGCSELRWPAAPTTTFNSRVTAPSRPQPFTATIAAE